jgi:predicted dehydrogenase
MLWVTRATGEMLDLAPVVLYRGKDNDITTTEFGDIDADWGSGFRRSSAHFVDSLIAGTPAAMTAAEAVKVLQLCFAVYAASDTRQPVDPRTITGSVTPQGWADW